MSSPLELLELARYVGLLKKTVRTGWVRRGVPNPESVAEHSYRMSMLALFYAPTVNRKDDPELWKGLAERTEDRSATKSETAEESETKELERSEKSTEDGSGESEILNVNECCKMCLVHDLAEGLVGDLVVDGSSDCRDNISREEKQRREEAAIRNILLNEANPITDRVGNNPSGKEAENNPPHKVVENNTSGKDNTMRSELLALWYSYEEQITPESRFVKDLDRLEMLIQADEYEEQTGVDLSDFYESTKGKFVSQVARKMDENLRMKKRNRENSKRQKI